MANPPAATYGLPNPEESFAIVSEWFLGECAAHGPAEKAAVDAAHAALVRACDNVRSAKGTVVPQDVPAEHHVFINAEKAWCEKVRQVRRFIPSERVETPQGRQFMLLVGAA